MKFNPLLWSAVSEDLTVRNASGRIPITQVTSSEQAGWCSWLGRALVAFAVMFGMAAGSLSIRAGGFPYIVSFQNTAGRPAGGNGGGGDIVVFDINGVAPAAAGTTSPGGHVIVFDGVDGGVNHFGSKLIVINGDITDFITDFVIVRVTADTRDFLATHEVTILGQSRMPGVFEAVFDDGEEMFMGLVWLEESEAGFNLGIWY